MNVWKLIAHHENGKRAIEEMKSKNRLAIGWSDTGDLSQFQPMNSHDITKQINITHNNISNAHLGGPSLWNFYQNVKIGDIVMVNSNGKRKCVFEVTGDYFFANNNEAILKYKHQRTATLTDIDAEKLWLKCGAEVETGENLRWTFSGVAITKEVKKIIYKEGLKHSVTSTLIERNPKARKECIDHYGSKCFVCSYDFFKTFGELGRGYIHIHHIKDISLSTGIYDIDPIQDLIPLCPNCHAMAHKEKPAISIERLKKYILNNKSKIDDKKNRR